MMMMTPSPSPKTESRSEAQLPRPTTSTNFCGFYAGVYHSYNGETQSRVTQDENQGLSETVRVLLTD